jgi:hypothetical protein
MLVVPLARQEHHPVLAEGDGLAVAVGGDVMDAVNRHCSASQPSQADFGRIRAILAEQEPCQKA